MLSHINTKDDSIPTINSDFTVTKAFNTFRIPPSKCPPERVLSSLEEYMNSKQEGLQVEELENALFLLGRELRKVSKGWDITLKPFVLVHPLLSLSRSIDSPKSSQLVEKELTKVIHSDPVLAGRYLWTVKAMEFVNDLALRWGILSIRHFAHRNHLRDSVVPFRQLSECPRLDALCLLPEVFYIAANPSSMLVPDSLERTCSALANSLTQILQLMPDLNKEVNFEATPHIRDYLFRSGRITPATVNMREKQAVAARVGFHLLSLPSWWRVGCVQSEGERANERLKRLVTNLCREYLVLERHLARVVKEAREGS